jgi:bacteriocin biosynthesis cyclodehydratase domain-containing protein
VLEFEGRAAVRLLPHLLPLLDGTRTVAEIVASLGEPVRPAVVHALRMLAERKLLTEPMPEGRTVEYLVATDVYGRDATTVAAALSRARVTVVGAAETADRIAALLGESLDRVERAGFDGGDDADLIVVAPAAHEVPRVRAWNERALEREATWLQVLPFDGLIATVGPIFVPRQTACYECYRLRRAANIAPVADHEEGAYPGAPAFDSILAGLAATIALRRVALGDGRFVGVLLAVEEIACARHVLYRVPRCPVCSTAVEVAAPAPWHALAEHAA